ncbi:MarR family winged helix-turn-helix transcriptional regulator [Egibacter rhizosphaerae]|nr:MarR family winged helix-turn-helix transcriptional regulator [Egibacter rhizosphaerae]
MSRSSHPPASLPERLDAVLTGLRRFWQRPAARAHFDARLDRGLEPRDYRTLRVIGERGGCSVSAVARDLVLDQSTASRLVDRVVNRGYVARNVDDEDRRRSTLQLTEQGEAALAQLVDARRSLLRQLIADWPEEDVTRLVELLERLDDASRSAEPHQAQTSKPHTPEAHAPEAHAPEAHTPGAHTPEAQTSEEASHGLR